MKKTLILAAAFTCAAFSANAQKLVDSWTVGLGSWQVDKQAFIASDGFIFANTDRPEAVEDADNFARIYTPGKKGLYEDFFYHIVTGPPQPIMTLDLNVYSGAILSGVQSVGLSLIAGGFGFDEDIALNINSGSQQLAAFKVNENVIGFEMGADVIRYTYYWNVTAYEDIEKFTFDLTVNNHGMIREVILTQYTEVVPEPSTYALIAGAFGLATVVVARRRRRA